jgi:hypothetical protein
MIISASLMMLRAPDRLLAVDVVQMIKQLQALSVQLAGTTDQVTGTTNRECKQQIWGRMQRHLRTTRNAKTAL